MPFRFRKSFKLFPGARLNLGTSGVSLTLGGPGASVNLSGRGARATVGIPGSGLSYSTTFGVDADTRRDESTEAEDSSAPEVWTPGAWTGSVERFKSGPTAQLTSPELVDLRELMCSAREQKANAQKDLKERERRLDEVQSERRWKSFFLWSWLFRRRLSEIPDQLRELAEEREELERWVNSSGVVVETSHGDTLQQASAMLAEALESATKCSRVWDVLERQSVDRSERSAASSAVDREVVKVSRKSTPWVDDQTAGYCFGNENGDPLVFYPGFLLVDGGERSGPALISYRDLSVSFSISRFIEEDEECVPDDSEVIDETWAKVNRDGSPDRRFKENYRMPVVAYGTLALKTKSGLDEVYQFSRVGVGMLLATALVWIRVGMQSKSKSDRMAQELNTAGEDLGRLISVLNRYGSKL